MIASGAGLLLGLVPAPQELLRCLFVAPLHGAHKRNVVVVLFAVPERARLPSLLKKAQMVGALMVARVAQAMDREAGVGLGSVLVLLELEIIAQIVELDVTVDDKPLGEILQPRHAQAEMPFRVGDGQLLARLLLAVFGHVFARENVAVLASERAEEVDRSAPPGALAIGTSLVSWRRRHAQDARKLGFVLVLHRVWIQIATHAQRGTRDRGRLYAAPIH